MACTALVVGFGFAAVRRGEHPRAVVWVGIVSNGGGGAPLCAAALLGTWSTWRGFAQIVMWGSLVGTGVIAARRIRFGALRGP